VNVTKLELFRQRLFKWLCGLSLLKGATQLFEKSIAHKRELVAKKLIVNDRLDALMGTLSLRGGGGVIYFENFCLSDVCNPKNAARTYRISSSDFLSGICREFGAPSEAFL